MISFDFKQAVRECFDDYPHLRKTTLFVTTAENTPDTLDRGLRTHGSLWLKAKIRLTPLQEWLSNLVMNAHTQENSFAYRNPDYNFRAAVINPEDSFYHLALPAEKEMSRAGAFYHELGHLLCKSGFEVDDNNALGESCADAYAALRLIKDYGDAAHGMIARNSWYRAAKFLDIHAGEYLTAPVTLQLLADAADGRFARLSPADMVSTAEHYAHTYAPTPSQIAAAAEVYAGDLHVFTTRDSRMQERLRHMAETCLRTPDRFSFEIGALVLNPFLGSGGYVGQTHLQIESSQKDAMARRLDRQNLSAAHIRLHESLIPAQSRPPFPRVVRL